MLVRDARSLHAQFLLAVRSSQLSVTGDVFSFLFTPVTAGSGEQEVAASWRRAGNSLTGAREADDHAIYMMRTGAHASPAPDR